MNPRVRLAAAASVSGGAMLTAAFLQTAVAAADTTDSAADGAGSGAVAVHEIGDNAFTFNDYVFDPGAGPDIEPLFSISPLIQIGGAGGFYDLVSVISGDTSLNDMLGDIADKTVGDLLGDTSLGDLVNENFDITNAINPDATLGDLISDNTTVGDLVSDELANLTVGDLLERVAANGDFTDILHTDVGDLLQSALGDLIDGINLDNLDLGPLLDDLGGILDGLGGADWAAAIDALQDADITGLLSDIVAGNLDMKSLLEDMGGLSNATALMEALNIDLVGQGLPLLQHLGDVFGDGLGGVIDSALGDQAPSLASDVDHVADALASIEADKAADVTASAIQTALSEAGFGDDSFTGGDLSAAATALAGNADLTAGIASGDVSAGDITSALDGSGVSFATEVDHIIDALNGINAAADVSAGDIETVLADAGFSDANFSGGGLSDAAAVLAGNDAVLDGIVNGDAGGGDITDALADSNVSLAVAGDAGDIAGALNGIDATADVTADDIETVLADAGFSDVNFTGGGLTEAAGELAGNDALAAAIAAGDAGASDITTALQGSNVSLAVAGDAGDIADALNGIDADKAADVTASDIETALSDAGFSNGSFTGGDVSDVAELFADDKDVIAGIVASDLGDGKDATIADTLGASDISLVSADNIAGEVSGVDVTVDVTASDIETALSDAGFGNAGFVGGGLSDVVDALVGSDAVVGAIPSDAVDAGSITTALDVGGVSIATAGNIAGELNGIDDAVDITASDIETALSEAGFSDYDFTGGGLSEAADVLVGNDALVTAIFNGDVGAGDITDALEGSGVSIATDADHIADALDGIDAASADDVSASDIESALSDAGFGDDSFINGDLAAVAEALANNDTVTEAIATGDVGADDVTSALGGYSYTLEDLLATLGIDDVSDIEDALGGLADQSLLELIGAADTPVVDFLNENASLSSDLLDEDLTIGDLINGDAQLVDLIDQGLASTSISDIVEGLGINMNGPIGDLLEQLIPENINESTVMEVYDTDGDFLGNVDTTQYVSNILGIHSAQLVVTDVDPAEGVDAAALPAEDTTYSVTSIDLGMFEIQNIYTAVPTDGGDVNITDTLSTPLGDFDLSTMFNAIADLFPADVFAGSGFDDGGSFGDLVGGDLFGGLFGGDEAASAGDEVANAGTDAFGDLLGGAF